MPLAGNCFLDHVSDLDPCKCSGSNVEDLEAHHGSSDPLDEPVILFKNIFEIFDLPDREDLPHLREF